MTAPEESAAPVRREEINVVLRGARPEIRRVLLMAHEQGFRVSRTNSGHFKIMTPEHWEEKKTEFAPKTPSDIRSVHRVICKLRRIGVKVPHR